MLRKSMVAMAVLAAINTQQANALGLGEVTVHSALNQPLNAEINLLQLRDLSKSQIIAGLADADDFYLAGVKPTTVLSDINFQLDIKNGQGVIKLTTSQPIREPFLNFLVEVNWPSGRLVREYTVLLDPPVFTPQDLNPRSAPSAPAVSSAPTMQSQPMKPMAAPLPKAAVAPSVSGGKYKVGKQDTLWNIALKTRPDASVSPQQMMMALQRMNPDAFVNNNINRLKSGVVLSIPSKEQILAYDSADAVAEVKRQNSAWKGSTAPKPKAPAAPRAEQLDATKQDQSDSGAVAEPDQSQLRIVSKSADTTAEETAAEDDKVLSVEAPEQENEGIKISEELLAKNEELEEQLVVTLEGLDKVERDNAELFDRLEKLSGQLESMQQLLTLKDQQMSDLQQQLAEAQAAPPPPPVKEKSFLDTLMGSPAIIGGILAALLAALLALFFISRKRRAKEDDQAVEQAMAVLDERDKADTAPVATAVAAAATVAAAEALAEDVSEESVEEEQPVVAEPESTPTQDDDPFDMDDDLGDFDSLISDDESTEETADLDMDLEIDEPIEEDPEMAEFAASLMEGDEFDLSVDEDESGEDDLDIDDELNEALLDSAFDGDSATEDDLDLDLTESDLDSLMDEALGESADEASEVEAAEAEETSDDLDFVLADNEAESSSDEEDGIADDLDSLLAGDDTDIDEVAGEQVESIAEETAAEPDIDTELDALLDAAESDELDAQAFVEESAEVSAEDSVDELDADLAELDLDALEADAFSEEALDTAAEAELEDSLLTEAEALEDPSADLALEDSLAEESGIEQAEAEPAVDEVDLDAIDMELDALDLDDESLSGAEPEAEIAASDALEDMALEESDSLVSADALEMENPLELDESLSEAGDIDLDIDSELDSALDLDTGELEALTGDMEGLEEPPVLEPVTEEELDELSDADLENELDMALADEANELSIDETDLVEEEGDLDYLEGADELGTKLDLARAYIDMDDLDGAREILQEVINAGDEQQSSEAKELLDTLG